MVMPLTPMSTFSPSIGTGFGLSGGFPATQSALQAQQDSSSVGNGIGSFLSFAAPIALGIVGAVVGTLLLPGIGTAAGAELGADAGIAAGATEAVAGATEVAADAGTAAATTDAVAATETGTEQLSFGEVDGEWANALKTPPAEVTPEVASQATTLPSQATTLSGRASALRAKVTAAFTRKNLGDMANSARNFIARDKIFGIPVRTGVGWYAGSQAGNAASGMIAGAQLQGEENQFNQQLGTMTPEYYSGIA